MASRARIGRIDQFDESVESWCTYVERLEQYFTVNEVKNEKKVAALLTLIGGKTYALLRNLTAPVKPAEKTYDVIVQLLTKHLNPTPLVIAERFRFHKREQKEGESINVYIAELRRLSEYCNFGATLDETLRDRFVCGVKDEAIQRKLLSVPDLTLNTALEKAIAMETAKRDAIELQGIVTSENNVHKVNRDNPRSDNNKNTMCNCCGKMGHKAEKCWFKDANCRKCHKRGHLEKVCRGRSVQKRMKSNGRQHNKQKQIHQMDDELEFDPDLMDELSLNSIRKGKDAMWINPTVNGKPLKMELDTGSAVSIIPKTEFTRLFTRMQLEPTNVVLKTYSGEKIAPIGKKTVTVNYNGQIKELDLFVVESNGPALFGRSWLEEIQIDWNEIKALKVSEEQAVNVDSETTLKALVDKHSAVFQEGIGTVKGVKAKLTLKENSQPKFHKARSVPYSLKPKVEAELDKLEDQGILTKVNWSEWATPIVPIPKRNGDIRICGDFKVSVSPQLKVEQYPLPKVGDIFATLAGGKKFTKLDLRQAYLQLEMEEECKQMLTINTHKGLYQYNRLIFGIASAPAIWQRTIDQILQGLPKTQCILDDMIITGASDKEHFKNLEMVLKRLEEHGLRANLDKCEFFKEKIVYCGHEIDKDGLHKTQEKVKAILNAPKPTSVQQLRAFLGLVNYYHRFLPNLSTVVHPMNRLLEKGRKWKWAKDCQAAFEKVKELMTSDTFLTHYDPNKPVKLACDASPYGLGAVMSHVMEDGSERPIAFASRSITAAEKNYSQIDKEALALVWGVKKFHVYLYGRKFTLVTDHQPLVSIFSPTKGIPAMTAARLQRYALFLGGHDYEIEYKSTHSHSNADGLSRLPLPTLEPKGEDSDDIFQMSQIEHLCVSATDVRQATSRDAQLSTVLERTMKGWSHAEDEKLKPYHNRRHELTVQQGCLMWGIRVIIPSKLRKIILEELHDGHQGMVKMKALARSYVWWPGIDKDIEAIARSCPGCQRTQNMPAPAPLHPWEWPLKPWQRIHIDYAGPFANRMFLVIVDAHSKWPEILLMNSTTTSSTVEALRTIFSRYGVPEQLVSDNGPQFTSDEFKIFMRGNGIKHITSAPYHPKTNGLAERCVQTFKQAMKAMKDNNGTIQRKLSTFLINYRKCPHSTTGESPAKLFLGREIRTRLDAVKPDIRKTVQDKQTEQAMKPAVDRKFDVGQQVSVRDYRPNSTDKWIAGRIDKKTGPLSYRVEVAPDVTWRRHVEQLRDTDVSPPHESMESSTKDFEDYTSKATNTGSTPSDVKTGNGTTEKQQVFPRRNPPRLRKAPDRLDL